MTQEVIMIVGCPASGKGTYCKNYITNGYIHINRDVIGGRLNGLRFKFEEVLNDGKSIILDNTHVTIESRKTFIDICAKKNIPIHCKHLTTSTEDAQINALVRMYKRYNKIFYTAKDIKDNDVKDPNIFPIAALFTFKKRFEPPKKDEGFESVEKIKFERKWDIEYKNSAVIFDYDGTLRETTDYTKYPLEKSQIRILPGRKEKLKELKDNGTILLGVSNQSGVGKGELTMEQAVKLFDHTNRLLDANIEVEFCPHYNFPVSCYCRKPQVGLGVYFITKYKLDPNKVTMVGDMTTDKTFAKRLSIKYMDENDYFKGV